MSAALVRERMSLVADFLADNPGYEPSEVGPLQLAEFAVRRLIGGSANFELSAANKDRPDAEKYGTFTNGEARHAPEWYAVHGAATRVQEGLHGALRAALMCPVDGPGGEACVGGIGHSDRHHDGAGANWVAAE